MFFVNSDGKPTGGCIFLALLLLPYRARSIQFAPKYQGKTVTGLVGSSVNFTWSFSGNVYAIDWGFKKDHGVNALNTNSILVSLDPTGPVSVPVPAAYTGRVSGTHHGDSSSGQAVFTLGLVKKEDENVYGCRIASGDVVPTYDFDYVQLVVEGDASVPDLVQFAEIGTSVTCTCDAKGVPSQYFEWKRQGQAEEITSDAKHLISSPGAGSSQLTIKNISVDDHGYYVCDASVSVNQPSSATCYVQVLSPVKQNDTSCHVRSYTVVVGQQLSICCPVSGYPPPVVTWEKNGAQLRKGENTKYTITAVKDKDFGNYSCTATDGKSSIGPFNSSVTKMGPASVHPPYQFAEVGRSATFTCNATDVPSANFTWMRQGNGRITGDAQHTIVSVTGSSQLTIKNVTASDHGYYVCDAAVNQQANAASFYLQVSKKLTEHVKGDDPYNKRNYSVDVGEQLSISCPDSGYPPPSVTWEKNGTQLLKGENVRLIFNPVKDDDFGKYTCTCTDGKTTIGPLTIRVKPILGMSKDKLKLYMLVLPQEAKGKEDSS